MTPLGRFADRVLEGTWLAAAATVPLYFNVLGARIFEPDKATLLRNLTVVAALAWAVKTVAERPASRRGIGAWFQQEPLLPAATALLAIVGLSTVLSIAPRESLAGSYAREQGLYTTACYVLLMLAVAANIRSRAQLDRLVTVIILTSVPVGAYALVQEAGLDPFDWAEGFGGRATSTAGNPIFLGAVLAVVVPLTLVRLVDSLERARRPAPWLGPGSRGPLVPLLALALVTLQIGLLALALFLGGRNDDVWWSVQAVLGAFLVLALASSSLPTSRALAAMAAGGYTLALGLELAGLAFSRSRGPLVGLLVGCWILALGALASRPRRLVRLAPLGAGLAVVLVLVTANVGRASDAVASVPYAEPLTRIFESGQGSGRLRVVIWRRTIELVADHPAVDPDGDRLNAVRPLVGYGPETLRYAYQQVFDPEQLLLERRGAVVDRAHNALLDVAATSGLLGLAAYLLVFHLAFALALERAGVVPPSARRRVRLVVALTGLVGVVLLLVRVAWRGASPTPGSLLSLGVLGLLATHFVEALFGIEIVAPLVIAWLGMGVLVALGRVQDDADEPPFWAGRPAAAPVYVVATLVVVLVAGPSGLAEHPDLALSLAFGWLVVGVAVWSLGSARSSQAAERRSTRWIAAAGLFAGGVLVYTTTLPSAADVHFREAGQTRRPAERIAEYQAALRLAAAEDPYYTALGGLLAALGRAHAEGPRVPEAPTDAEAVIDAPATSLAALSGEQAFQAAEPLLVEAERLVPVDADHAANLGRLYRDWALALRKGDRRARLVAESERWLRRAVRLSPNSTALRLELGSAYYRRRDYASAIRELTRAIDLEPLAAETSARELRGDAHLARGETAAALADYRAALGANPAALSTGNMGARIDAVVRAGGARELALALRSAAARVPGGQSWAARYQLGLLLVRVGRIADAAVHLRDAEALLTRVTPSPHPELWRARRNLGLIYAQLGRRRQALRAIDAARSVAPEEEQRGLVRLRRRVASTAARE